MNTYKIIVVELGNIIQTNVTINPQIKLPIRTDKKICQKSRWRSIPKQVPLHIPVSGTGKDTNIKTASIFKRVFRVSVFALYEFIIVLVFLIPL